jgi:hypothetical protein
MPRESSELIKHHNMHGLPSHSFLGAASARAVPVVCLGVQCSTFPRFRRILSVLDERLLQSSPRHPNKRMDAHKAKNQPIPDQPLLIHSSQESLVIPMSDFHSAGFPPPHPPSSTLPLPPPLRIGREIGDEGLMLITPTTPLNPSKKRKR